MRYLTAYKTDQGIRKQTNQDALLIKKARTDRGEVLLTAVCDGMGGLEKGEVASREVIDCFSDWFEKTLPNLLKCGLDTQELQNQWIRIAVRENHKIAEYGAGKGVELGTTLTAMLIVEGRYYVVHVGDCRIYELSDRLYQITEDQTVVAREIAAGRLSEEQAKRDPRRNILLQCIGASEYVEPEFFSGYMKENAVYLLCSDGMRHKCTPKELWESFCARENPDKQTMEAHISEFIGMIKQRKEKDNISCIMIKAVR